ncbi:hypothetical protein P3G55_12505 [Leptospira sp. 96542]|nr:hypothetical protein [Leptospira sp. 96542]
MVQTIMKQKKHSFKIYSLLCCILCLVSVKPIFSSPIPKDNWHLVFYGGIFTETDLLPIVLRQKTEYQKSYIGTLGLYRPLDYKLRFIDFGFEGNITKHFGTMNHWEFNAFYIAKIDRIAGSPFGISIGEGLSLASENPKLENKAKGYYLDGLQKDAIESRALLNYLMVEVSSYLPFEHKTELFLRVHHRSGIFGLYCPPDPNCGSNFISYGFRTAL